jgi:hypothetical protein
MSKMIQQTSLDAYSDIEDSLGERQLQVLRYFRELSKTHPNLDFTNTELSFSLELPINRITPRVYELRNRGYLEQSQIRYCRITGKRVIAWKLKRI